MRLRVQTLRDGGRTLIVAVPGGDLAIMGAGTLVRRVPVRGGDNVPTYSYACTACEHHFDTVQKFTDPSLTDCPECSGRLRKLFSSVGIVFKGSGFYRTDSRAGGPAESSSNGKSESGSNSESKPGSKSESTSESKSGSDSASSSSASSSATAAAS
jgi:putative FmdB family regulatory protein